MYKRRMERVDGFLDAHPNVNIRLLWLPKQAGPNRRACTAPYTPLGAANILTQAAALENPPQRFNPPTRVRSLLCFSEKTGVCATPHTVWEPK